MIIPHPVLLFMPGELTPTVLFLASEEASYITGQVIPIDGRRTAQ
jgi:NAD(P)-dependent dehydrogenase (short-subunit alcohol dehydrogenase family)